MFVDSSQFEYIGFSKLCSLLSVEWLIKFEDIVHSLLKHVSLWYLFFDLHQITHKVIYEGLDEENYLKRLDRGLVHKYNWFQVYAWENCFI